MRLYALLFLACGIAQSAHADLIQRDLSANSGDQFLTYDSRTNLEWLDVTLTQGRSFDEVASGWGGWLSRGFRIAHMSELDGLIQSAGLQPNYAYNTLVNASDSISVASARALIQDLGITFIYEDQGSPYQRRSTYGYVTDDYSPSRDYFNYGRYADIGFYELGWTTLAWANDGSSTQVYRDSQYSNLGTFLVRDALIGEVPEPGTCMLLLVGLTALLFFGAPHTKSKLA